MSYKAPNVVPRHVEGWSQIRTSFYNELLQNQNELQECLQQMVKAFNVPEIDPLIAFATIEKRSIFWRS